MRALPARRNVVLITVRRNRRAIHATSATSSSDADSFDWSNKGLSGHGRRAMDGEDRTGGQPQDALGDAAHDQVIPAPSSVRAAHDQIHGMLPGVFEYLVGGVAPGGGQDDSFYRNASGPGRLSRAAGVLRPPNL